MHDAPYRTELKPYGRAFLELARARPEIVCLSGDLTRQCEIDLFRDALPDRFVNGGMAEANLVSVAGGMARDGLLPWVHTFGVFATRRAYDQVAMSIAYPNLPVRLVGFMPGISSPGGPSHQAIDDVALMRALPNMTVIDVADAVETAQVAAAIVDLPGPVYLRLKRGEIPVIFDDDHRLDLQRATVLRQARTPAGVTIVTNGMMLAAGIAATSVLEDHDVPVSLVNVPVIKPFDAATITRTCTDAAAVVAAENHSVIGGLGSAVAETLAEGGLGCTLRRVGLRDTFAEGAATAAYLFEKYGLSTQAIVDAAWDALARPGPAPQVPAVEATADAYAPV